MKKNGTRRANVRRRCVRTRASPMASRALHHSAKKLVPSNSSLASRAVLFLLCAASLYLCFSLFRKDAEKPSLAYSVVPEKMSGNCDYSDGRWIYDPTVRSPPRYDQTCKEIFKGWNCIASNKTNAVDILKWRWKPRGCDLPPFDPRRFLEEFRDNSIGFVGDSLNRNMFASLFCALKKVSPEVKKWRPVGADRGFTFLNYNLTIAYHRTNLLARYGRWSGGTGGMLESLGYKDGYRVDVDIPEGTWAEAPRFHDILIFNTGHWWWAPSKFDPLTSPMLFFEKGVPVDPPLPPDAGLDLVLRRMISFIEKNARENAILFFRTQSPRHFEGGDWDQGGSCSRVQPIAAPQEVEQLFSIKNNGTNVETRLVNQHLRSALGGSKFQLLDITHMSEFRADAHPSTAGGKRHDDCMHWCLPGLTDTWNDLLVARLINSRGRQ